MIGREACGPADPGALKGLSAERADELDSAGRGVVVPRTLEQASGAKTAVESFCGLHVKVTEVFRKNLVSVCKLAVSVNTLGFGAYFGFIKVLCYCSRKKSRCRLSGKLQLEKNMENRQWSAANRN